MKGISMAKCKGCGRDIVWIVMGEKRIPLDPSAPCYGYSVNSDGYLEGFRVDHAFVSHFATCRMANQFSGGPKEEETEYEKSLTTVAAGGRSYDHKETLKSLGFRWRGDFRRWEKKVMDSEIDPLSSLLREKTDGECRLYSVM